MAAVTRKGAVSQLKDAWHYHQCRNRDCRLPYSHSGGKNDRGRECPNPNDDPSPGLCYLCSGMAHGWPIIYRYLLPRDCCAANMQQVTDPETHRMLRLAGTHPWYRCTVCQTISGWPNPTPIGDAA